MRERTPSQAAAAFKEAYANLLRAEHKQGRPLMYFLLLLATWVLGFLNALEHAKDAWASMPMPAAACSTAPPP